VTTAVEEQPNGLAADGTGSDVGRVAVVGLLADPGRPTQLAEVLPDVLVGKPEDGMRYRFVVVTDSLRRLGDARDAHTTGGLMRVVRMPRRRYVRWVTGA
jgi:hypothetical protein